MASKQRTPKAPRPKKHTGPNKPKVPRSNPRKHRNPKQAARRKAIEATRAERKVAANSLTGGRFNITLA